MDDEPNRRTAAKNRRPNRRNAAAHNDADNNNDDDEPAEKSGDQSIGETGPPSPADEEADRAIDRRSSAVALTVAGYLPNDDVTLMIVDYERLYVPPILQQVGRWYNRLNYRLSKQIDEAVTVRIAWKSGERTSQHATMPAHIVGIRPVNDSVVFVVRKTKGELHDFVPTRDQNEVMLTPVIPVIDFPTTDLMHLSLISISNARQAVYEQSKKNIHRLVEEAEIAAAIANNRCRCCDGPLHAGRRRRRK